jgi:hypothetical protein
LTPETRNHPLPTALDRLRLADGLTVTRLGYGAMQLPGPGVWGPPRDRDAAVAVLRRAVDLGLTHVDSSDAYGPGVANELIRQALSPYPAELVVATKVGVVRDQQRAFAAAGSPADLHDQVERNLRGLGRDRLDLVYLRVGGGGDVLAACERHGIAFVAYFPLAAGMLDPDLDTSQLPPGMGPSGRQQSTLREVARRHGATWAQVAIAWLLARSPVTLAIPGTGSVTHLEENVAAAQVRLSETDLAELDELAEPV